MLKKNSVNELCLSCHDGSDATAPDVMSPVEMYSTTNSKESSAGYFAQLAVENPNGHSLGVSSLIPLQSSTQSIELNCASCHAVHGNGNYRNLLVDPAENGGTHPVVTGVDVFTNHPPDDPPTVGGSIAAYDRDNVAFASKMSEWCSSCHDLLSVNSQSTAPAHFNGHPSDVPLNFSLTDRHTDPQHWIAGLGDGFLGGATDNSGIPRVPFLAPQATNFLTASTPHESNMVSCISCHKAHGSDYKKSMRWPLIEGGEAYLAGCQQCHNK